MIRLSKIGLIFLSLCISASAASQDKVVVIPLGGVDGPFADMYWVTVASNGSMIKRTPGVISSQRFGPGNYGVFFDVPDTAECFAIGSKSNTDQFGTLQGDVGITREAGNSSGLFLDVRNENGVLADSAFTLQLSCPPEVIRPPVMRSPAKGAAKGSAEDGVNQEQ